MTDEKYISSISNVYAKALFEALTDKNSFEKVRLEFVNLLETIKSSNELSSLLSNQLIKNSKKIEVVDEIFKEKINEKLLNLLKLLIEKSRLSEIEGVYNSYSKMVNEKLNQKNVQIISAIDLDEVLKTKIMYKLKNKFKSEILPDWQKDEGIIGGLVFIFDDNVLDTSIRHRLKDLSKNIMR